MSRLHAIHNMSSRLRLRRLWGALSRKRTELGARPGPSAGEVHALRASVYAGAPAAGVLLALRKSADRKDDLKGAGGPVEARRF